MASLTKSTSPSLQEEHTSVAPYTPGSDLEKKLLRKIDLRIVPTIWVLYTMSYLDRANIGNAFSGGLQEDFGITSNQYSVILLLFFVSYVVFEVPSNMILSRVRPSIYLSVLCFLWGAVAACMGAPNNWRELAGIRFCLGVVEAGFAPGIAFYLSSWYKKHELARRYSIYYTATAVSGAFSGLLAGVITEHLAFSRGIEGWRWLLIIEGVGSCFVACFAWMILPDWPSTTKWLTEDERNLAVQRLRYDGIGNTARGLHEPKHKEAARMAFTDWRVWVLAVMYMLSTGSQTIQYFVPLLVGQLGYTGYHLQYMTIPVYAVALVGILTFCFVSDWRKERGNYISLAALIAGVSFIVIVAVDDQHVKYVFLCFGVGAIYAACPLTLLWVSNVVAFPAEKRAVAIALVNSLGNSASIYGSFLWPRNTGPRFVQGFATTTAFVLALGVMAQMFKVALRRWPAQTLEEYVATHVSDDSEGIDPESAQKSQKSAV